MKTVKLQICCYTPSKSTFARYEFPEGMCRNYPRECRIADSPVLKRELKVSAVAEDARNNRDYDYAVDLKRARISGYEAPIYICWGQRNRSALIRVPRYSEGREKSTRLELRCPDPSCNPYLAFAVMLAAGLKGIKEKIEPPDPVEEDVYGFDDRKLAKFYIKTLPEDLGEAIEEFKGSKLMKETLGEHVFSKYLEIKTAEWDEFQKSVTDWELNKYRDL